MDVTDRCFLQQEDRCISILVKVEKLHITLNKYVCYVLAVMVIFERSNVSCKVLMMLIDIYIYITYL